MTLSEPPATQTEASPNKNRTTTLLIGIVAFLALLLILVLANATNIQSFFTPSGFSDFSTMQVEDGFHKVSIPNGNHWEISYETSHEAIFQGLVKYNYAIREKGFEILTQDILVTSGDFSDPQLVYTKVADHHFVYRFRTTQAVAGTINLLHTVPVDEEVHQQLLQLKPGDLVVIKGWEIYNLKGYDAEGNFVGVWQDAGCNTTLITQVVVLPPQSN